MPAKVAGNVLQCESDGEPGDAQPGDETGHVELNLLQRDQGSQNDHRPTRQPGEQASGLGILDPSFGSPPHPLCAQTR